MHELEDQRVVTFEEGLRSVLVNKEGHEENLWSAGTLGFLIWGHNDLGVSFCENSSNCKLMISILFCMNVIFN